MSIYLENHSSELSAADFTRFHNVNQNNISPRNTRRVPALFAGDGNSSRWTRNKTLTPQSLWNQENRRDTSLTMFCSTQRKGQAGPHCRSRARTSRQPGRGLFVTFPSLFAVCTQASLGIHSVSLAAGISLASLSPFSRQRPLFLVSYLQFDRVTVTLASYSSSFNRGNNGSCLAMNRI